MFDLESLVTDTELEVEGVWRDLPKGAKVKIARWNNKEFQKMMRRNFKSNRVILEQDDDISDEVSEDILIKVMAHTVLRDLTGAAINGQEIKYTPEVGMKLLKIKDFRDKIKGLSEDMNAYQTQKENEAVKS